MHICLFAWSNMYLVEWTEQSIHVNQWCLFLGLGLPEQAMEWLALRFLGIGSTVYYSVLPSISKACRLNKPSIQNSLWCGEWGQPKSFEVAIGSTHTMPSYHALNFTWGEHWYTCMHMYIEIFKFFTGDIFAIEDTPYWIFMWFLYLYDRLYVRLDERFRCLLVLDKKLKSYSCFNFHR